VAGLKSIIRLRKHQLDEKRRAVTRLQLMLDNMKREEARAVDELVAEKQHATTDRETAAAFPNYNKRMQDKLKLIVKEEANLKAAIDRAQAELQDAFKELKTIEITDRERARRAAAEEKKKEDQAMDEIGLEGFRRKDK